MLVKVDKDGFVTAFAADGATMKDGIEVEKPEDFENFFISYNTYQLLDGKLSKSEEKSQELAEIALLDYFRQKRAQICFPVVNRGELWYKRLTPEQIKELEEWYQAWLDITDTKIVPNTPKWI